MPSAYESLLARLQRVSALGQSLAHLEWDQHTYMPAGGVPARSQEMSVLSSLAHELFTSAETGRLLAQAEKEETDDERRAVLRETRWGYDRATLVPQALVEEMTRTAAEAFPVWAQARQKSDFAVFRPHLERLVELRRRYAQHINANAPAYEVLFNDYEPWIPLADARRNLAGLREGLRPLIAKAADRAAPAPTVFDGAWPADRQHAFAQRVVAMLGYEFEHGRLDVSPHPFSTGNPYDARITTRYDERSPVTGLLAAIHETGHALYTQGLPKTTLGTPLSEARDLVVHESQSRLWENHVGRSLPFWEQVLPLMREHYGAPRAATPEEAWRAVNHVAPTFIRVDADELTYHMHIALRFEVEEALVSGATTVREVPSVWNDRMQKYLGIRPPDDARGCLQDMHWSGGAFGYFPTYSLGSMLSAQLHQAYQRATRAAPTDHKALREWLRENVHRHGKRYKTGELVERATGAPLTPEPFLAYAREKYSQVWASG